MRVCRFRLSSDRPGAERFGLIEGERIAEFAAPRTVAGLHSLVRKGARPRIVRRVSLAEARLLSPTPRPGKILAAIVNTKGMLGGEDLTLGWPRLDMKAPSAVIGPEEWILAPESGLRPEVELGAIIGERVSNADVTMAKEAIFGYTVVNDVTSPADAKADAYEAYRRDQASGALRKVRLRGPLFRSKNHDGFCPMGPCLVTADELTDTTDLRMTSEFRGAMVQDGSTSQYIFSPEEIASFASQFLTLEPGDVVSCGSVGWTEKAMGRFDPSEYVLPRKNGTLRLEVEGIGVLRNHVVFRASRGSRWSRAAASPS